MTATYGDHAEGAAAALRALLIVDDIPIDVAGVNDLFACREALLDALGEQLLLIAGLPSMRSADEDSSSTTLTSISSTIGLLDHVMSELPRQLYDKKDGRSPADVLGPRRANATIELWRRAAVDLLAGSHALAVSDEPSWEQDQGAAWHLVRDVAVATEAVLLLDQRLDQVGLLNEHDRPAASESSSKLRMKAAHASWTSSWYAASDSPDQVVARVPPPDGADWCARSPHEVVTVNTPRDLVAAQRRLALQLRPLHQANSVMSIVEPISLATSRQVFRSQLYLTGVYSDIANKTSGAESLASDFKSLENALTTLVPQLTYLVDIHRNDSDWHVRHQQGEITRAVIAWRRNPIRFALTLDEVVELANTTHEVIKSTAVSLRREGRRPLSNIGVAMSHRSVARIARRSPLDRTLTELINHPAPTQPATSHVRPLHRAALKSLLDLLPTETPSRESIARALPVWPPPR